MSSASDLQQLASRFIPLSASYWLAGEDTLEISKILKKRFSAYTFPESEIYNSLESIKSYATREVKAP